MNHDIITPEGYAELEKELDYLWRQERPEITKIVQWAASLGDRSENADYQYNKRKLREIDRRVRFLRNRLEKLRIVYYSTEQEGKAYFGAWVTLIDEDEKLMKFKIVGPDEIYGKKNYVSINAPIAKACLGKSEGDEIIVKTEEMTKEWEIQEIHYK